MSLSYLRSNESSRPGQSVAIHSHYVPQFSVIPPEVWEIIFEHATAIPQFFDTRWNNGVVTPFDEAQTDTRIIYRAFSVSIGSRIILMAM